METADVRVKDGSNEDRSNTPEHLSGRVNVEVCPLCGDNFPLSIPGSTCALCELLEHDEGKAPWPQCRLCGEVYK